MYYYVVHKFSRKSLMMFTCIQYFLNNLFSTIKTCALKNKYVAFMFHFGGQRIQVSVLFNVIHLTPYLIRLYFH